MSIRTDNYVIHPIPLCTVEDFPRANLHWLLPVPSNEKIRVCHYAWYIEGPGNNYLVDAGVTPDRFVARNFKSVPIQDIDEGLERIGLEIGDIDYIIVTHSHYDHTTNLRRFPKVKAIIQEAEIEQIKNPFPYTQPRLPKDFQELFVGVSWEVIRGDTKIDHNIELILTPGHSAGGQSVAIKTAQGTAVITGWCCVQENFDPPIDFKEKGFPFTISVSHTNPVELYESTRRIIDLADLILPCHEYESIINRETI
ncbi:MAG: N-acyl homoserine lactonase family protein [Deltaproteobacteria bacterium]|nr:N-acyl homoserine lactonase family protein [Deltaproteobacteria bacterium]